MVQVSSHRKSRALGHVSRNSRRFDVRRPAKLADVYLVHESCRDVKIIRGSQFASFVNLKFKLIIVRVRVRENFLLVGKP